MRSPGSSFLDLMLCSPSLACVILGFILPPGKQWAAERTLLGVMREPPHTTVKEVAPLLAPRMVAHGQSPMSAIWWKLKKIIA